MKKKILLCVTGGIALYKSLEIIRLIKEQNIEVKVALSRTAAKMISPVLFETLSQNKVVISIFENSDSQKIEHIDLAQSVDLILIAPATANIIGKFANGIADDLISTILISTNKPLVFVPAMNSCMWEQPSVKTNINKIKKNNSMVLEPQTGSLACGTYGMGKMQEPIDIVNFVIQKIYHNKNLNSKKALVVLGATREYIDPFRFISNGSSGKMGVEVAYSLFKKGIEVSLIFGSITIYLPPFFKATKAETSFLMRKEILKSFKDYDIIIMCAAIADYKPIEISKQKIKEKNLNLSLVKTKDILAELGQIKTKNQVLVGFSAESNNIQSNAQEKLKKKNLNLIFANQISLENSGFDSDYTYYQIINNKVINKAKKRTKREAAEELVSFIEKEFI